MLKPGDIIQVFEHPYSDHSYFVGEVYRQQKGWIYCQSLKRVRGGRPLPLTPHTDSFKTPEPDQDPRHDHYRTRMNKKPRIARLQQFSDRSIWQPGTV